MMKHIFWVHSYITYFVAKKIIAEKKLDKKDVIFLKARNFDLSDSYIDFKQLDLVYKFSIRNILRNWRLISRYDRWIDKIAGKNKYILYYPHTALRYLDYLLTNKNCQGYCLMEEGMAAYSNNLKPVRYKKVHFSAMVIKDLIMYRGRVSHSRSFYNDDYLYAYGLSELAFEGFSRRLIFDREFNEYLSSPFEIKENDILFMLSSMVDTGEISEEKYIESVIFSLKKYFELYNQRQFQFPPTLYIKSHPGTDVDSHYFIRLMSLIKSFYTPKIEVKLWNFGPVEALLCQKELVLLAIDSSVMLYAAMNGIKVYCFQDVFIPFVKHTINRRIEEVIPRAISQKIYFIK